MIPLDLSGGDVMICLTDSELEKYGLDGDEAEEGDEIHLIGRVRSVDKHEHNGIKSCRIMICLERLADEHETEEEEEAEQESGEGENYDPEAESASFPARGR